MKRTFDGARFQRILEHPDVIAHVSLGRELRDVSGFVEDRNNHCLMNDHGGVIFYQYEPDCYEAHIAFVPDGRGAKVLKDLHDAIEYIFETGARVVVGFAQTEDMRRLAEGLGFQSSEAQVMGVNGYLIYMGDVCQQKP